MTTSNQSRDQEQDVRSEIRGRHWIAWVPDESGKPRNSVVLVADTREEAERRAREWDRTNRG